MKRILTTLCLTVLLISTGVSRGADLKKEFAAYKAGDYTEDAELEMIGLKTLGEGLDGVFHGRANIVDDFYKPAMSGVYDIAGGIFTTGHISTNMQIEHLGDEATTLAYFFEIVANDTILIGTYQHRMRRDPDRWRFHRLRITVRYHAVIDVRDVAGCALTDMLARPI